MTELNFDTGRVTYTINENCEVSFNPTDSAFAERLFKAFETLDNRQESYKAEIEKVANKREIFDLSRKLDGEMREVVNGVFETDVCTALFGGMNVYSLADGLPVWCNLLLAVMDEVDTSFTREQKAMNPRVQKYVKKYHK